MLLNGGISIIGAGRVGSALAVALARAGYSLGAVVSRSAKSAEEVVRLAGQGSASDDVSKVCGVIFSSRCIVFTRAYCARSPSLLLFHSHLHARAHSLTHSFIHSLTLAHPRLHERAHTH